MNKKGFTLIELLVVIAIIALLVSILMPGLSRARELAKRASCASNASSIGKAIALYQGSYKDAYPWVASQDFSIPVEDGAVNDPKDKSNTAAVSITRLLYLLVRDGQGTALFVCPSADSDTADTKNPRPSEEDEHRYDFTDAENVSYGYQRPLEDKTNGVTGRSSSQVAILADSVKSNPDIEHTDWDEDNISTTVAKAALSHNHTAGEYINVLYADSHVGNGNRGDLGHNKDSIYTASGKTDGGDPSSTSTSVGDHTHYNDSYIFGPIEED